MLIHFKTTMLSAGTFAIIAFVEPAYAQDSCAKQKQNTFDIINCAEYHIDKDNAQRIINESSQSKLKIKLNEIRKLEKRLTAMDIATNNSQETGPVLPQIQLRTDIDESDAEFTYSSNSDTNGGLGSLQWALTATVPIDQDESRGDFITENGLPNKWGIGGSITINFTPFDPNKDLNETDVGVLHTANYIQLAYRTLCAHHVVNKFIDAGGDRTAKKPSAHWDASMNSMCELNSAWGQQKLKTLKDVTGLSDNEVQTLKDALNNGSTKIAAKVLDKPTHFANFSVNIGGDSFSFRDPNSFATQSERELSFATSAFYGFKPKAGGRKFFGVGAEYKEEFVAPNSSIRCQPSDPDEIVECTNAVFGPPQKQIDAKIFGVARYLLNDVAIEFRAAYDGQDNEWGVELPIYLISDESNRLNGGIRFAYDSDDGQGNDDFKVGIFISQPFSLSGN